MKDIPERLILSKAIGADPTIEDAARASASLERAVKRRGLTHRYESGIILSSEGESGFRPSAAFVVVEEAEGADASGLASIPAGRYVCIRYDESSAASRQKELGAFLSRKRIVPSLMLQADLLSAALSLGGDKAELQVLPAGPRGVAAASSAPSSGDRAPRRATKPRR